MEKYDLKFKKLNILDSPMQSSKWMCQIVGEWGFQDRIGIFDIFPNGIFHVKIRPRFKRNDFLEIQIMNCFRILYSSLLQNIRLWGS